MKIKLLNGGGTIVQKKSEDGNGMEWSVSPIELISNLGLPVDIDVDSETVYTGLSANYSVMNIVNICRILKEIDTEFEGTIITVGTDVLEEIAFAVDYLGPYPKPVVFVAAMRPSTALSYDGPVNLYSAVKLLVDNVLKGGDVVATISDRIHCASKIAKIHSERIDAFESSPGHIGEMRNGNPIIDFKPNETLRHSMSVSILPKNFKVPKIGLITTHVDMCLDMINIEGLDGLVVAGMGTGAVPDKLKEYLSRKQPMPIPIVVSTRCVFGSGYNDYLYTGGIEKYEKLGFVLREFFGLNALKARLKLSIDLMFSNEMGTTLTYF